MNPTDENMSLPEPVNSGPITPDNLTTSNQSMKNQIPSAQTSISIAADASMPQEAKDEDLIEKEWVDKVDSTILKYREDPYNQAKELSSLKADYIKKRYNKIIQMDE